MTQAELRDLMMEKLDLDSESGIFRWKKPRKNSHLGQVAGWITANGYRYIRLGELSIGAHRLAWLWFYGYLPKLLDHKDENRSNNSISNLRLADKSLNGANRGKQKNNTSGFKGVKKHRQKWVAQITVKGENRYLGIFQSPQEAAYAYEKAAREFYGEFAKTG
jgi:hypothetical protein